MLVLNCIYIYMDVGTSTCFKIYLTFSRSAEMFKIINTFWRSPSMKFSFHFDVFPVKYGSLIREAFQSNLGKSSKLGGEGGSSEIKVPSSRGYQRLTNNYSFSSDGPLYHSFPLWMQSLVSPLFSLECFP